MVRKNKEFAEFKVHLIHRKKGLLLYNTVLILCNEGVGLVAVIMRIEHIGGKNVYIDHHK